MTALQLLIAFVAAAGIVTITPGLDTALVLRTAVVEGSRRAMAAGLGIGAGCLAWAALVALGLGALLAASTLAYTALKWAGALYLVWLGLNLILKPRDRFDMTAAEPVRGGDRAAFARGFLTNILNPKVGVFYVSFLPQFIPAGAPTGAYTFMLGAMHVAIGMLWFLALVTLTRPLSAALRRGSVIRTLDRVTGGVFIAFGVGLVLQRR